MITARRAPLLAAGLVVLLALIATWAVAAGPDPAITRGTAFLLSRQQADGSWDGHVGITSVVLLGLLERGEAGPPPADAIARGFRYVERWVRPDGGIYQEDVKHYTTAVALLALLKSGDARYRPQIAAGRDYLLGLQAREENGFPPSNPLHGGTLIGDGKANLDASFFAARALKEAGLPRDHPYWARLIRFVSRCQNLKPTNDQPWAGSDGGFVFSPGFSFAGGTTSYGSMTYAGLSAYLDAGLTRADERVEAALRWLGARFTTRENPGLGSQTLFHSYFYMAHTLTRWRTPALVDGAGTSTPWRVELVQTLHRLQRADGSWANEDPRWWESNPVLATAFAVRALKEAAAPAGD